MVDTTIDAHERADATCIMEPDERDEGAGVLDNDCNAIVMKHVAPPPRQYYRFEVSTGQRSVVSFSPHRNTVRSPLCALSPYLPTNTAVED